jgi:5-methyltetrahydrofolate--homocysteine methyltransferase
MSQKQIALKAVTDAFAEVVGTDEAEKRAEAALKNSASPTEIIQSLRQGLDIVGRKYEAQEYFLSELIMAGVVAEKVIALLRPHFATSRTETLGRVVIGTAKGDIHDIGKKLVSTMLISAGFDMIDIGVDIPAEDFLEATRKNDPKIVALSCLLTSAMDEMRRVVETIHEAGLRGSVRVLVGGRPVSKQFADEIGADGYGANAVEAMKAAKDLLP